MKNRLKYLLSIAVFLCMAQVVSAMDMMMTSTEVKGVFSDVSVNHPNYKAIVDLKARGVIAGYPDGTFRPDNLVNRVEALKIILGGAKVDVSTFKKIAVFKDTDSAQWYAPFLNKAVELNIVAGYSDGSFKPTQTVNLAENLKILLNARGVDLSKVVVDYNPYLDALKNQWYAKYFQFAKMAHLIDADLDGRIFPDQGMTRAKLAEIAYRLIYMQEKQIEIFPPVDNSIPLTNANNMPSIEGAMALELTIKNMAFSKVDMVISTGSTVSWTNVDNVPHSIISDSGNELSSAVLQNGDVFKHTFNQNGVYSYHCGVHSLMKAKITVKPAIEVPTI